MRESQFCGAVTDRRTITFSDLGVSPSTSFSAGSRSTFPAFFLRDAQLGEAVQIEPKFCRRSGRNGPRRGCITPYSVPRSCPGLRTLEHFPAYVIHHTNRTRAASQGSTPELACTSGNFSFRTDSGKPVAWPKDECISVTAPDLNARHRVALLCDGERQQCELNRLLVSSFIA